MYIWLQVNLVLLRHKTYVGSYSLHNLNLIANPHMYSMTIYQKRFKRKHNCTLSVFSTALRQTISCHYLSCYVLYKEMDCNKMRAEMRQRDET